jgi:lysophospholipase L1-like esterase
VPLADERFTEEKVTTRLWIPGAVAVAAAVQAVRLGRAIETSRAIAALSTPFEHQPPAARGRVLFVGDSTGVGVGAASPAESLPGLLADEFPMLHVVNLCRNGDQLLDVPRRVEPHRHGRSPPFDAVLLMAGGNDVLQLAPADLLRARAARALTALSRMARHVVWLGPANIGLAPAFTPPVSWWLGWHTMRACRVFAEVAASHSVEFVDFCAERRRDPFSADPARYFATDRLHPSGASYRYCYEALKQRTRLLSTLQRAITVIDPPRGAQARRLRSANDSTATHSTAARTSGAM